MTMKLLPGLSLSWRRALGVSALSGHASRRLGISLTRSGREKKVGRLLTALLFGKRRA